MNAPCADFAAVLLAGGKSTRMGFDKSALVIDGVPLWQRQLATLRALHPAELLISGPLDGPWHGTEVTVVADEQPGLGPLSAFATILSRMRCDRAIVLAVDLPAMTPEYLRRLASHASPERGVVPVLEGRMEPLAAIYPRTMAAVVARCMSSGMRSVQECVREAIAAGLLETLTVPAGERLLFQNLNTPADVRCFVPR